jgi:hypothetical protein
MIKQKTIVNKYFMYVNNVYGYFITYPVLLCEINNNYDVSSSARMGIALLLLVCHTFCNHTSKFSVPNLA